MRDTCYIMRGLKQVPPAGPSKYSPLQHLLALRQPKSINPYAKNTNSGQATAAMSVVLVDFLEGRTSIPPHSVAHQGKAIWLCDVWQNFQSPVSFSLRCFGLESISDAVLVTRFCAIARCILRRARMAKPLTAGPHH
jgi:hypothetical protein